MQIRYSNENQIRGLFRKLSWMFHHSDSTHSYCLERLQLEGIRFPDNLSRSIRKLDLKEMSSLRFQC